jgi:hypothetical protein
MVWIYFTYKREKKAFLGVMLSIVCGALAAGCMMPALFLQAIFVIPALLLWSRRRWPAYTFLAYIVVVAVGSYGFVGYFAMLRLAEYQKLRNEYAFESMESRLPPPKKQAATKWQRETEEHLVKLGNDIETNRASYRTFMLQRLHQDSFQSFIQSPEFGVGRQFQPSKDSLTLDLDLDGIAIPQPGPLPPSIYPEDRLRELIDLRPEPLRDLHLDSVLNFVNPRGFGWIVSRQKVAGFQAHQFNKVPQAKEWKIQTLELVGLLMHEEPVVYLSDELPRMDKLRKVPTRPLNVFETAGIQRLHEGDDLFIRETSETIRMLGAVRSIDQCVKCHGGDRGDLLGAFSYRLERLP